MSLSNRPKPSRYVPSTNAVRLNAFRRSLLRWWTTARRDFPWRRSRASRYLQIVSEVLLQRTKAKTVAAFWPTFIDRFPNWRSIAIASVAEIECTLKPIGLSKQRAPRLKGLAVDIANRCGRFPVDRREIEALPGVGQYIANAIELFISGKPRPLVDVNMSRVLERYFGPRKLADIRHDPYLQRLATRIVHCRQSCFVNWAILDLSALVCRPEPNCVICPLKLRCKHGQRLFTFDSPPVR
jgi:A/G-specific adenine glycosylase